MPWAVRPILGSAILRSMFELFALVLAVLCTGLRGRTELLAENPLLRHQLAVLTRPTRKRPAMRRRDKLVWILARVLCRDWRRHLVLVGPRPSSAGTAAA